MKKATRGCPAVAFFVEREQVMSKGITLKLNKEFKTLYYHGRSVVDPLVIVYARKNRLGVTRTGITTGKKLGGAVQRSRCRRIIRAAYDEVKSAIPAGWDLVFVARVKTVYAKSTDLVPALRRALAEVGVLPEAE